MSVQESFWSARLPGQREVTTSSRLFKDALCWPEPQVVAPNPPSGVPNHLSHNIGGLEAETALSLTIRICHKFCHLSNGVF